MIFVTTGTQLPFERLVRAMDEWAETNPDIEIVGQIGKTHYQPQHFQWLRDVSPQQFQLHVERCHTVVAHAGMGTIISGIEAGKRVLVMPRRAELQEHRNDHQLATAAKLSHLQGLEVVTNAEELHAALNAGPMPSTTDALQIHPQLVRAIRDFAGLEVA